MSEDRKEGRRAGRREFRPALDSQGHRLEPRMLLTKGGVPFTVNQLLLTNPSPALAFKLGKPPMYQGSTAHRPQGDTVYTRGYAKVQTIRGGTGVEVATADGSHFRIQLELAENLYDGGLSSQTGGSGNLVIPAQPVQAVGTVRAYPMPGNKVGLVVDGTTQNMELVIERLPFPQRKGYAHSFAYGQSGRSQELNIGSLNVTSGKISGILGFQTANLSGPLTVGGGGTVDRIALNNILPGGSIKVGGTLNTLDVFNNVDLSSGPGVDITHDLNLLNVGQNLTLSNGSSLRVGRFLGATPQPPKGTGTGSNIISLNASQVGSGTATLVPGVSAYVKGDVTISGTSVIGIGTGIANSSIVGTLTNAPLLFLINGKLTAPSAANLQIPNLLAGSTFIRGILPDGSIVYNNVVARNGVNVPGIL